MTEDDADFILKLHKMGWLERKVRKWWMQRDLWKSYEKALKIMWEEYETALALQNKELSDQLFIQMLQYRKVFEEGRAAIDAVFETVPKIVVLEDESV